MSFKHKGTNDGPPNYDYVECDPDCPACLAAKVKKLELQVSAMQKVVNAALAWEGIPTLMEKADRVALDRLVDAVAAYRNATEKRIEPAPKKEEQRCKCGQRGCMECEGY